MAKIVRLFVAFFLIFTLELPALNPSVLSFDNSSEANARLAPLFKASFGKKEINVEVILKESIQRLSENESGKHLLERLGFLCGALLTLNDISGFEYDGVIHISFKDGEGTCFAGSEYKAEKTSRFATTPKQNMRVTLNLDLTNKSFVFNSEYEFCSIIPAIKRSHDPNFCEIGECFDPFWITVGHELIHMEHFLTQELNKCILKYIFVGASGVDNVRSSFSDGKKVDEAREKIRRLLQFKNNKVDIFDQLPGTVSQETLEEYYIFLNNPLRFHARYARNREITAWASITQGVIDDFPELQARCIAKDSLSFFDSVEERETVVGSRCSELTIRMAEANAGRILPIRYLYQASDKFFLEDISVMMNIINKAQNTLGKVAINVDILKEMLADIKYLNFFNLGLCSHVISQELLPDSGMAIFFKRNSEK